MFAKWARRWAGQRLVRENTALRRQVDDLAAELEAEQRKTTVVEAERDNLAAVIARDRERIKAEGAAYARERAESEGVTDDDERTIARLRAS